MGRRRRKKGNVGDSFSGGQFDLEKAIRDVAQMQMATAHVPAIVAQEVKKAWKQLPNVDPKRGAKSWMHDPLSLQYSLGYKDRRFSLTYETLKRIAGQLSVISAIINTRSAQVAAFAQPYRWTKSLGFVIRHKDPDHQTTPAEMAFIKELEEFVLRCGRNEPNPFSRVPRDDFEMFLRKIVRDSLIYDQATFEIVPDRLGLPYEFLAVDASTLRIAADDRYVGVNTSYHSRDGFVPDMPTRFAGLHEGRTYGSEHSGGDPVAYVQVINGQIENVYSHANLAFGVRNPRTDIYIQGYGFGELEQLITVVTAHLYAEEYNRKFFCITPGTYVTTRAGLVPVEELSETEFEIWNGQNWRPARAFETGKRPLVRTKLWNGLELCTSPAHRFLVIPRESVDGSAEWRTQSALKQGDTALVGYTNADAPFNSTQTLHIGDYYESHRSDSHWTVHKNVGMSLAFWEFIGFAIGDGYWPQGYVDGSGKGPSWMRVFPHHTKDRNLFQYFIEAIRALDIHIRETVVNKHHVRTDGESGYPALEISHVGFLRWLYELGFRSSSAGKRIPAAIFKLPSWIRCALLRGLFSADGHAHRHRTGYVTPTVFATDLKLRQDVLQLLWSVGVASNETGSGWARKGEIRVQDVAAFVERIGYLQDYKNEGIERSSSSEHRWDKLQKTFAQQLATTFRSHAAWSSLDNKVRDLLCKVSRGVTSLSRPRAIQTCYDLGIELPQELNYVHAPVDVLDIEACEEVLMFDVEVFDDEHIFLANHVVVHNSQGSAPKGLLNLKGDNYTPEMLEGFKRQWMAQAAGVENAWRTPIMQSEGIEWIDLNKSNTEMEFSKWIEYLIKISCGVFLIDPAEINFEGTSSAETKPAFEGSQEWKLKASRDRGLKPLLRFLAKMLNKNIIDKIDDHFTLEFVGLDELSETEKHEMLVEQISSYMTLNEARRTLDLPDLPGGDIPMNPVYIQGLEAQGGGEGEGGGEGGAPGDGEGGSEEGEGGATPGGRGDQTAGSGDTGPKYSEHFGLNLQEKAEV